MHHCSRFTLPTITQKAIHSIDAVRISDDRLVAIKRTVTDGSEDLESKIALMLSSEPLASDSRNHCVPILDSFQDDENPRIHYLVMPFLRRVDNPPFQTVEDVCDFTDQILEVCGRESSLVAY